MLKSLVEYIVKSLVEHPDIVQVNQNDRDGVAEILVNVDKGDIGRIIGKDGQTIKAIRSLVAVVNNQATPCDVVINDCE